MDDLDKACEQFLGKTEEEMKSIAKETLEGHQRAMMGTMTVEVCTGSNTQVYIQQAKAAGYIYNYE